MVVKLTTSKKDVAKSSGKYDGKNELQQYTSLTGHSSWLEGVTILHLEIGKYETTIWVGWSWLRFLRRENGFRIGRGVTSYQPEVSWEGVLTCDLQGKRERKLNSLK